MSQKEPSLMTHFKKAMRRYESELSSTASHIVFGYRSCSDLFLRAFQEICVSETSTQSPKNHSNLYVYTLLCCFCIYCFHRFLEDQGQNEWKRESKGTVLFDSFSLDVGHSESRRTVPIDSLLVFITLDFILEVFPCIGFNHGLFRQE